MKSLILALLVGTIFLVFPFGGKAVQGDDSLKLYLPSVGEKGKVVKDKSENGNDETMRLTLNQKDTGYRGIWYYNQPSGDEYVYKYSGGLGTYCAKHRPFAVYRPEVDKTFFCYGGTPLDAHRKHTVEDLNGDRPRCGDDLRRTCATRRRGGRDRDLTRDRRGREVLRLLQPLRPRPAERTHHLR